jgi:Na+/H+-dicarboxylate symporter
MPKIAIFLAIHLGLIQPFMGISPVVIYGGKILTDVLPNLNKAIPIVTTLLPAITAAFTTELMRKYGRKTLLQLGALTLIIPLTVMCLGFAILPYS